MPGGQGVAGSNPAVPTQVRAGSRCRRTGLGPGWKRTAPWPRHDLRRTHTPRSAPANRPCGQDASAAIRQQPAYRWVPTCRPVALARSHRVDAGGCCCGAGERRRVALNALTGNRLEPSRASSVRIRPISSANLPASLGVCAAFQHLYCDPSAPERICPASARCWTSEPQRTGRPSGVLPRLWGAGSAGRRAAAHPPDNAVLAPGTRGRAGAAGPAPGRRPPETAPGPHPRRPHPPARRVRQLRP
jgi:hypothetical protein